MQDLDENTITAVVIERLAKTPNPRLRHIMSVLIQHLHEFARETELTEEEWWQGITFLTDCGHMTNDRRQELVLLSDTLGLSMLVIAQNNRKPSGCTEATVFGPFHVANAPEYALGADVSNGAKGRPCEVDVQVRGLRGEPVRAARVEIWQADSDGFYDMQYAGNETHRARGVLHSDDQGRVYFRSVLAEAYPIPNDGPVGRMLTATGRHPWRPAHMHFMIEAPGYEKLVTHVFRDGDRYLNSDAVFGVRSSLITRWDPMPGDAARDGQDGDDSRYILRFEFVLNPL